MKNLLPFTILLLTPTLAWAQTYVIDFEDFNTSGAAFEDVSESLLLADVGGSGVDVTINGGGDMRIYDLIQYGGYTDPGPQALIDWNWSTLQNLNGTDIEFSTPVSSMSLIAGEFGGDDDSPITISAYDAAGNLVDSDSTPWNGYPPFELLSVSGIDIVRVHYSSGGIYPNSTFFDNITFEPSWPTSPTLSVSGLKGGGTALFKVHCATPGGRVGLAYSYYGPGPTLVSAFGCSNITVFLTQPQLLSIMTADANGAAYYSAHVPVTLAGMAFWFHAVDVTTCQTTNGLAEVVL